MYFHPIRLVIQKVLRIVEDQSFTVCIPYSGKQGIGRCHLNGVYAAVVVRALVPAYRIALVPGGSGACVDEPLALAKARDFEFELLPEPIQPKELIELLTELTGGDIEPIRSMSLP